ncbi:PilZ domain-containing protein [Desulfosporosinus acidiphilus SJ4]|uniref:PilZ domain-containing protein n=1 Tax=Desulfosporosinus acidiphilus (strain DSM 22704 / JCM 16185 / SJ4) TaxID=646529 RepID=I4D2X0_DESAJ|nr:PilZ domain-containing protein [Desulfosporosinus acidiphilus]AFM40144.1 PilZ domain-containing protein [Desulfosporosinus acidiphilus SJ4]
MPDKEDARSDVRLTYNTIIQCTKCISEGKVVVYAPLLEIQVMNISREGLCITTEVEFKEGALLEFDITLGDTLYKSISARVLWSIKDEDRYRYGMHINYISGKLSRHIYQIENRLFTSV